ncbi:F-box/kelch-repeat protein At3g06240-like [Rutidosis leptorrhynchoides]|uniref:F-box/kelch-repeat protein At3g06240-like n=1 Tax=Rutidosis leptorrhynchoides TaxID=125765 RepID=UPI003A99D9F4
MDDDGVVEKILARLDVEDVLRCKSVCKSWYNLISSDYFVKANLKRSYNNNREHGYIRIRLRLLRWTINIITKLRDYCMVTGSCNSLVCISSFGDELLVTNLCTREVRKLPMPPYKCRGRVCWGFGYDSSTDDYKLVVCFEESNHHIRFQVVSLKSNKWKSLKPNKWKFVEHRDYLTYNTNSNTYACGFIYNGALHWFLDDTKKKRKMIVSFDLCLEKFKEIPLPNDTEYVRNNQDRLGMLEERLCICIFRAHHQTWVMKNCNGWQLLPPDYQGNKYGAVTPAYKLD